MKRLNPKTKKPFKLGDLREDGFIFWQYKLTVKNEDGFFREVWREPDLYSSAVQKDRIRVTKRQQINKDRAIAFLGGACHDCGLVSKHREVYDFHHVDPSKKDINPTQLRFSFERMKAELKKCVLLCANCHRIRHATQ